MPADTLSTASPPPNLEPQQHSGVGESVEVEVPSIGDSEDVVVIEVLVAPGDEVRKEDSLITLESDKATMEVPSPCAGVVTDVLVNVNDRVSAGTPIVKLDARRGGEPSSSEEAQPPPVVSRASEAVDGRAAEYGEAKETEERPRDTASDQHSNAAADANNAPRETLSESLSHASPGVRRFARELGIDLRQVHASGPKGRVLKEDVQSHVKGVMTHKTGEVGGFHLPQPVAVDHSKYGATEIQPLSRIRRRSGPNLHRNWLTIPHVTQFDEADITDLDRFRKDQQANAAGKGIKLTLTAFLIKACVAALQRFPQVNSSLTLDEEALVIKKYYHIGVAVETDQGLVVPVLRDADRKGLLDIAAELSQLSSRARAQQLTKDDLQGGSFTISSLGGLGGTGFTPIINGPEVAILGVSRAQIRPVFHDGGFVPRLILPFSLSYDHRVVDGADAVRFTSELSALLGDLRRILL